MFESTYEIKTKIYQTISVCCKVMRHAVSNVSQRNIKNEGI